MISSKSLREFFISFLPAATTYLTFYYVDGGGVLSGMKSDLQSFKGMFLPTITSILIFAIVWLFLKNRELTKTTKNAYLWAWVANHFDLRGAWQATTGNDNPVVYKCFDNAVHTYKEVLLDASQFSEAMIYLSDRYEKNGGYLSNDDRIVFETNLLRSTVTKK